MRPSLELGHEAARRALAEILQGAHAGERGAALAYGGHWRSLRSHDEIAEVHQIELDEIDTVRGCARCLPSSASTPIRGGSV